MLGVITRKGVVKSPAYQQPSPGQLLEERTQHGLEDLDCGLCSGMSVSLDPEVVCSHGPVGELLLLQFGHHKEDRGG